MFLLVVPFPDEAGKAGHVLLGGWSSPGTGALASPFTFSPPEREFQGRPLTPSAFGERTDLLGCDFRCSIILGLKKMGCRPHNLELV